MEYRPRNTTLTVGAMKNLLKDVPDDFKITVTKVYNLDDKNSAIAAYQFGVIFEIISVKDAAREVTLVLRRSKKNKENS